MIRDNAPNTRAFTPALDREHARVHLDMRPHPTRPPFVEYVSGYNRCWRLWYSYNPDRTAGTFLELHPLGTVYRVTIDEDGTEKSRICVRICVREPNA